MHPDPTIGTPRYQLMPGIVAIEISLFSCMVDGYNCFAYNLGRPIQVNCYNTVRKNENIDDTAKLTATYGRSRTCSAPYTRKVSLTAQEQLLVRLIDPSGWDTEKAFLGSGTSGTLPIWVFCAQYAENGRSNEEVSNPVSGVQLLARILSRINSLREVS